MDPINYDKTRVFKKTIDGLVYVIRDTNLKDVCSEKYQPNLLLREKAFVPASYLVGGMVTNDRYAILSNHMQFRQSFNSGVEGYYVCQADSHYLCLDVYEYKGKRQILLLHLPGYDGWKAFKDFKREDHPDYLEIIEKARKKFEETCLEPAILEANTAKWLRQCSFPVGMTIRGELFPLEDVPLY